MNGSERIDAKNKNRLVYLDYAATSPLLEAAREAMRKAETTFFANASALHTPGHLSYNEIEETRRLLAKVINCEPDELIFTASASEANNTVIRTFAGREIITSKLEHHSILVPASLFASKHQTMEVGELSKNHQNKILAKTNNLPHQNFDGISRANLEKFKAENPYFPLKLPELNARLFSFMLSNNEIGEILDIAKVADFSHAENSFVHSDLTQSLGKIPLDVKKLGLDYATVSAHKIGGPVGVAALYVRKGAPLIPLILGGNQEGKKRGGTYNTIGIIGFKKALEDLVCRDTPKLYATKVAPLRNLLAKRILEEIPGSSLNTPLELEPSRKMSVHSPEVSRAKIPQAENSQAKLSPAEISRAEVKVLPNILNVSFEAAEGESIQLYLDAEGIIVSTGSACAAGDIRPSHVLMAKTGDAEVAHSSIRFSFGLDNTKKDVDRVMEVLPGVIEKLQGMSTIKMKGARL